ncbi:MAG: tRNA (adenine-N1)-methyltransferase [Anaerolineae bacterium]
MRQAAENDRVLLLSARGDRHLLTLVPGQQLHTQRGVISHDDILGQPFGATIRTHLGQQLYLLRPSIHDELMGIRRASQVIYPKELGHILLRLDLHAGSRVIEAGTGSGAMTMALANAVRPTGRVFSYDVRADMQALARQNLQRVGLEDVVELTQRDAAEGFLQIEVDAVFLDVREPEVLLSQVSAALAGGGQFGALVPTTNQIVALLEALPRFGFIDASVLEILHRQYRPVPGRLRPDDTMVGHTGYLVFARRILENGYTGPTPDDACPVEETL